jgi:hypothetical protein
MAPSSLDTRLVSSEQGLNPTVKNAALPSNGNAPLVPQTPKITADVLGTRRARIASGLTHYVTPEQIKEDLETMCQDVQLLDDFYREVTATLSTQGLAVRDRDPEKEAEASDAMMLNNGSNGGIKVGNLKEARARTNTGRTGSSLLRPIREPDEDKGADIPDLVLPEAKYGRANLKSRTDSGSGAGEKADPQ